MKTQLLFLFIVFTCYSCCPKEYDELNKDELSWLPYEVGDTLYFKSNLGNIDKWVVKERKSQELSYGEGHTRCAMVYYKASFYTVFCIKDSIDYEFALVRDAKQGNFLFSIESNTPGDIPLGHKVLTSDTLKIVGGEYLNSISKIESYFFQKEVGLIKYVLEDSIEIYEKL
jgi:hypothetical protein